MVLSGNSFLPPVRALIAAHEEATGVTFDYTTAGSEDLLPHVKQGSQGDVFVTHDPFLDYARDAGRVLNSVHVGFVAPVLAVQPGNPKGLKTLDDLAQPGLKVALSNPDYSTCGEMVRDLLTQKGIYESVMANVGNRLMRGHADLGNLMQMKSVDAVIMWNGVANTFKEHLEVVPVPYEYEEEIRVHVIALNYSTCPEKLAQFMELVEQKGKDLFAQHGYSK